MLFCIFHAILQNQSWALAIECCLGGLLRSYLCDNFQDSNTLQQIMKNCPGMNRRPQIIVSK